MKQKKTSEPNTPAQNPASAQASSPDALDTFNTISAPSTGLYKDKGSRFLAFAFHVESEDEVKEHLSQLRREYFDARHHCYAYILGSRSETYRLNDDGEPSGTAGRPIYNQLLSFQVTNTLVVVVRYFGGILLGTSGLIAAYKAASREALLAATIVSHTIDVDYHLSFPFALMNEVMRVLKKYNINDVRFLSSESPTHTDIAIAVRESQSQTLYQALSAIHGVTIKQ